MTTAPVHPIAALLSAIGRPPTIEGLTVSAGLARPPASFAAAMKDPAVVAWFAAAIADAAARPSVADIIGETSDDNDDTGATYVSVNDARIARKRDANDDDAARTPDVYRVQGFADLPMWASADDAMKDAATMTAARARYDVTDESPDNAAGFKAIGKSQPVWDGLDFKGGAAAYRTVGRLCAATISRYSGASVAAVYAVPKGDDKGKPWGDVSEVSLRLSHRNREGVYPCPVGGAFVGWTSIVAVSPIARDAVTAAIGACPLVQGDALASVARWVRSHAASDTDNGGTVGAIARLQRALSEDKRAVKAGRGVARIARTVPTLTASEVEEGLTRGGHHGAHKRAQGKRKGGPRRS